MKKLLMLLSLIVVVVFTACKPEPVTPENLKAVAISGSEIKLTWNPVDNASGYNVYQGTTFLANVKETSYVVANLDYNTTYCFAVSAVNGEIESAKTKEACATTLKEAKKLSKLSFDNGINGKEAQVFVWDKEQLKKIEYYSSDNTIYQEHYYTYNDEGLVSRIEDFTNNEYVEYSYNGNKLTKARFYIDGELDEDWKFTYENDKISKMELVYVAKSSMNSRSDYYVEFTWENDNITRMEGVEDGVRFLIDCKYDNKLNPLNNFWGLEIDEYYTELYSCKNNVTQWVCTYYEDETSNEVINYSYNYDGDYPIVKKCYDNVFNYTWYYEY